MTEPPIPNHVGRLPGLFEWRAGVVVDAPLEDFEVARNYPRFPDRGSLTFGMRLTRMSQRLQYRIGQDERIVHVVEVVEPGRRLDVLGPKPVYGDGSHRIQWRLGDLYSNVLNVEIAP